MTPAKRADRFKGTTWTVQSRADFRARKEPQFIVEVDKENGSNIEVMTRLRENNYAVHSLTRREAKRLADVIYQCLEYTK